MNEIPNGFIVGQIGGMFIGDGFFFIVPELWFNINTGTDQRFLITIYVYLNLNECLSLFVQLAFTVIDDPIPCFHYLQNVIPKRR